MFYLFFLCIYLRPFLSLERKRVTVLNIYILCESDEIIVDGDSWSQEYCWARGEIL